MSSQAPEYVTASAQAAQHRKQTENKPVVCDKNVEIESIKRRLAYFRFELQVLLDRVDKLKS